MTKLSSKLGLRDGTQLGIIVPFPSPLQKAISGVLWDHYLQTTESKPFSLTCLSHQNYLSSQSLMLSLIFVGPLLMSKNIYYFLNNEEIIIIIINFKKILIIYPIIKLLPKENIYIYVYTHCYIVI